MSHHGSREIKMKKTTTTKRDYSQELTKKLQSMGAKDACVLEESPGEFVLITERVQGLSRAHRKTFCDNLPKALHFPKSIKINGLFTRNELNTIVM